MVLGKKEYGCVQGVETPMRWESKFSGRESRAEVSRWGLR